MLDQNLYSCFQDRRPADPGALFLRGDRRSLAYADLDTETGCYAAALTACGVSPGDRVVVQVGKSVEFVLLYLACLRAGAVFVPLNPAYTRAELAYFLGDASPRVLVCDPAAAAAHDLPALAVETGVAHCLTLGTDGGGSLPEAAAALPPATGVVSRGRDDLAAILYTSGTTGRSKGAMITHGNLISNGLVLHEYWGWVPGDVLLHALPVFHVHGLFVALHCALLNGSEVIFLDAFDPARLVAELPGASVLMGVPTFYVRLLDTPGFDRSVSDGVRLFISGSAPLLPETFAQFAALTGQPILERYGMTEAGMITSNPYAGGERIAGTVGFALPGVSARVADPAGAALPAGEIGILEITGPNVFAGYWNMPEKTAEEFRADGYFITGDMATMAEDGRIAIVGRAKDLIISGGFNVYPKEVEEQLDRMPGVRESCVIGLPHPDLGEAVTAVIVPEAGGRASGESTGESTGVNEGVNEAAITAESVAAFLSDRLARFKQPRQVVLVDALPRNAMGKVQKKELREDHVGLYG